MSRICGIWGRDAFINKIMRAVFKPFGVTFLILLLTGCASQLGAYYDQNEYGSLVRLEVISRLGLEKCYQPKEAITVAEDLKTETEYFFVYTEHLPNNEAMHKIAVHLSTQANMMEISYKVNPPSPVYCKAKLTIFNAGVRRAIKAAASKRRE